MEIKLTPNQNTIFNIETLKKMFTKDELNHAAAEGAEIIAEEARRIVPVKTGNLKRNIIVRQEQRNKRVNAYVGVKYGKGGAPYAHIVEYGLQVGIKSHPFMRPAAQHKQGEAARIIINSLHKQALKRLK